MRFRYGYNYDHWGQYDDQGIDPDKIEAPKIVKYAAVERLGRKLLIKVATVKDGDLAQLNQQQVQAPLGFCLHPDRQCS